MQLNVSPHSRALAPPTRATRLLAATGSLFCSCVEGASKFGRDVRGVFPGFFPRDLEIAFVARFMMCLEDLKNADTQDQVLYILSVISPWGVVDVLSCELME